MTKIKELTPELTNQIAAGEVIERPSSVVKELTENAIDAGATQIQITFKDAGLSEIVVEDNGTGIAADEIDLAFERHATSKIMTQQDLFRIQTLGFRGEALASIAAVARVKIITNTGGTNGIEAQFADGKKTSQQPAAAKKGTKIVVSDLFYNTPARLKYLRSERTETAKTIDIVNRIAMSYPGLAISLVNNEHELLNTTGNGNLKQDIANIYGRYIAEKMIAIKAENDDFKIAGFVSLPEMTRSNRNFISILLNGRYIKNFQLSKAVIQGYGSKLMVGRFPIAVVAIRMDPNLVDVNVHPTKQEVRLSKEYELSDLIKQAIKDALGQQVLTQDALENLASHTVKPDYDQLKFNLSQAASQISEPEEVQETPTSFSPAADSSATETKKWPQTSPNWQQNVVVQAKLLPFDQPKEDSVTSDSEELVAPHFPKLKYIGQVHGTYLVAEAENGFYLVDQHAAQERVKYEQLRQDVGLVSKDQQSMLTPLVMEFPNSDYVKINDHLEDFKALGIYLEPFGHNSYIVRSHPTWFASGEEESTIREMIDYVLNDGGITIEQFREKTAILISCRTSIKANHYIDRQQAERLLADLAKTRNPYNCPHGRPVLVHFENKDLEKMFRRIQMPHQGWEG